MSAASMAADIFYRKALLLDTSNIGGICRVKTEMFKQILN